MSKYLFLLVLSFLPTSTHAQTQQLTITLPGGAPLQLIWIDPGRFEMGALPPDPDDENPPPRALDQLPDHRAIINEGFWLGQFELTQAQWISVMDTRPWQALPSAQTDPNHPAVFISWDDAQHFVSRLNQAAGDSLYRLPTEAEWEYACRAGSETRWSYGDRQTILVDYAWYERNAWDAEERYAHLVGSRTPNPWGLHDMHGNAEEWVQDWYGAGYYEDAPERDPQGPNRGVEHVLRGGSYADRAEKTQSSYRNKARAGFVSGRFGMRILARAALPTDVEQQSWGKIKKEER
jgi:formylglycine-generating enzyme required for sulfatase activity